MSTNHTPKYVEPRFEQQPFPAIAAGKFGLPESFGQGGAQAVGTIVFGAQPVAGDVLSINGTDFTFDEADGTGTNIVIGETLPATLDAIIAELNGSVVAGVALATYTEDGTDTLTITYDARGTAGNAFTLAATFATPANVTVSGATLEGGRADVAISLETANTDIAIDQDLAQGFTLADGDEFQEKTILCSAKGTGDVVVTPANLTGGTTITFDAADEFAILKFLGGAWQVVKATATVA